MTEPNHTTVVAIHAAILQDHDRCRDLARVSENPDWSERANKLNEIAQALLDPRAKAALVAAAEVIDTLITENRTRQ